MKANVVDLRYRMSAVLRALERRETVTVYYRGRPRAVITPLATRGPGSAADHPFFGSGKAVRKSPRRIMDELRRARTGAV